jgi:hypothetical protein
VGERRRQKDQFFSTLVLKMTSGLEERIVPRGSERGRRTCKRGRLVAVKIRSGGSGRSGRLEGSLASSIFFVFFSLFCYFLLKEESDLC